ncbi:MAG: hypothetical protein KGS72_13010 [Cyanobacteria bacterium REEB67]|nr:hypothetical protein [Cyanobacteria bacterium REEB67]
MNSRIVPLLVVLAFILGMLGYSQASRNSELKDGNRILADSYPKHAYQAAYEQKSDPDVGVMVIFSDGMGHVRVESNFANTKNTFTTIYDFTTAKKYFMKEAEKTFMVSGMSSLGMGFMDEEMFKSTGAEKLPPQEINGRPAVGYRSTIVGDGAAQIESWFDQSTGCLMTSKTKNVTYTLTRYTSKPPQSYLFEVPKDYKEVPLGF